MNLDDNDKKRVPKKMNGLFLKMRKRSRKIRTRSTFVGTLFFPNKGAITFLERVLHRAFYGYFSLRSVSQKRV